jgi:hypothetical protein
MPAPILPALVPYLATAGVGWIYYRRIRRSFGRQRWQPKRTMFRLAVLSLAVVGLSFAAVFLPHTGWGVAAGMAAGAVLGWLALRHTHVEIVDGKRYYTPNPWIGGALSLLLIGRLAWRWNQGAFAGGAMQASQQASPLTLAVAAALVTYFVANNIGLMLRMRELEKTSVVPVAMDQR